MHWFFWTIKNPYVSSLLFFQKKLVIVLSLDPTLEIDSTLEVKIIDNDLHQDHVHELRLQLEALLKVNKWVPLKIMTTTLKTFQFHKQNRK